MRSLTDIALAFAYRPATPETAAKHAAVRRILSDTAARLWVEVPDGPEKTLALRALQESGHWAHTAIALTAPIATPGTEAVARVLPAGLPDVEPPPGSGCGACFIPCTVECSGGIQPGPA